MEVNDKGLGPQPKAKKFTKRSDFVCNTDLIHSKIFFVSSSSIQLS